MYELMKKVIKFYNELNDDILLESVSAIFKNLDICKNCNKNTFDSVELHDCEFYSIYKDVCDILDKKFPYDIITHMEMIIREGCRRWYNSKIEVEKYSGNTKKFEKEINMKNIFDKIFIKINNIDQLKVSDDELKKIIEEEVFNAFKLGQKSGLSSLFNLGT